MGLRVVAPGFTTARTSLQASFVLLHRKQIFQRILLANRTHCERAPSSTRVWRVYSIHCCCQIVWFVLCLRQTCDPLFCPQQSNAVSCALALCACFVAPSPPRAAHAIAAAHAPIAPPCHCPRTSHDCPSGGHCSLSSASPVQTARSGSSRERERERETTASACDHTSPRVQRLISFSAA